MTGMAAAVPVGIAGARALDWGAVPAVAASAWSTWRTRGAAKRNLAERLAERRMREELEAYARMDVSIAHGMHAGTDPMEAARALASRVCRTVAERSGYRKALLLLRNAEGRFACVGSIGADDLTVAAALRWGDRVVAEERAGRTAGAGMGARTDARSFAVSLGEWREFDPEVDDWAMRGRRERRRWRRAVVVPVRSLGGRMLGAIAVCADGAETDGENGTGPIEALASRVATAIENEALTDRLLRAEKLAGLGQLAGGVAHALNNPLTAVLGFAELIEETTTDPRVREDAGTILVEALKMKATVERLVEFWRPATAPDAAVDAVAILTELKGSCEEKLRARGVSLTVSALPGVPPVRGAADRLRQVFEHLLNNAAQAIATARPREDGEAGHAIRLTVSHDSRALHVIVSDTGPGFREPGRVFDPFYTTRRPEQGAGLGLSICYGIVREHGGEISAFNLHPHGAAVVVELPIGSAVAETDPRTAGRARSEVEGVVWEWDSSGLQPSGSGPGPNPGRCPGLG